MNTNADHDTRKRPCGFALSRRTRVALRSRERVTPKSFLRPPSAARRRRAARAAQGGRLPRANVRGPGETVATLLQTRWTFCAQGSAPRRAFGATRHRRPAVERGRHGLLGDSDQGGRTREPQRDYRAALAQPRSSRAAHLGVLLSRELRPPSRCGSSSRCSPTRRATLRRRSTSAPRFFTCGASTKPSGRSPRRPVSRREPRSRITTSGRLPPHAGAAKRRPNTGCVHSRCAKISRRRTSHSRKSCAASDATKARRSSRARPLAQDIRAVDHIVWAVPDRSCVRRGARNFRRAADVSHAAGP